MQLRKDVGQSDRWKIKTDAPLPPEKNETATILSCKVAQKPLLETFASENHSCAKGSDHGNDAPWGTLCTTCVVKCRCGVALRVALLNCRQLVESEIIDSPPC